MSKRGSPGTELDVLRGYPTFAVRKILPQAWTLRSPCCLPLAGPLWPYPAPASAPPHSARSPKWARWHDHTRNGPSPLSSPLPLPAAFVPRRATGSALLLHRARSPACGAVDSSCIRTRANADTGCCTCCLIWGSCTECDRCRKCRPWTPEGEGCRDPGAGAGGERTGEKIPEREKASEGHCHRHVRTATRPTRRRAAHSGWRLGQDSPKPRTRRVPPSTCRRPQPSSTLLFVNRKFRSWSQSHALPPGLVHGADEQPPLVVMDDGRHAKGFVVILQCKRWGDQNLVQNASSIQGKVGELRVRLVRAGNDAGEPGSELLHS